MRELPRDFSDRTLAKLTPVHSANAGRRHRRIDCLQLVLRQRRPVFLMSTFSPALCDIN
jgi:hypothetical protein